MSRPLKFKSPEEMQEKIDAYFRECDQKEEPYTITGLALALDTTRHTLCDYEERDEFLHAIKKAKARVENYAEKRLFAGNATGPIFALKNFGWSDKQSFEHSGPDGKPIQTQNELSEKDQALLEHFYTNHYSNTEKQEDE